MEQQGVQQAVQQAIAMINVTEETKTNADHFVDTIGAMFETIEMLASAERPMKEGEWLELSKQFMLLHKYKANVVKTVIYVEQERIARRGRVIERKNLSKQQKLDDEQNYKMCPSCKKVLKKKSFAKHFASGICKHIADVKGVVAYNTGAKKKDDRRVKLSEKRILGGRSIAERSLILAERLQFKKAEGMAEAENGYCVWAINLIVPIYNENNEVMRMSNFYITAYDERDMGKYHPTLKYGTEHKIVWVKTEPYEKSTLIPYLRKCWAETMGRVVIPKALKRFAETPLRKSSWRRTGKGKWKHPKQKHFPFVVEEKKVEAKPTYECEACDRTIVEERDTYHSRVDKWVCYKCENGKPRS
tara:strand:- start:242 stop:1318 length:1077 start_codon:yes stop_codon:yes gene_type:complete